MQRPTPLASLTKSSTKLSSSPRSAKRIDVVCYQELALHFVFSFSVENSGFYKALYKLCFSGTSFQCHGSPSHCLQQGRPDLQTSDAELHSSILLTTWVKSRFIIFQFSTLELCRGQVVARRGHCVFLVGKTILICVNFFVQIFRMAWSHWWLNALKMIMWHKKLSFISQCMSLLQFVCMD